MWRPSILLLVKNDFQNSEFFACAFLFKTCTDNAFSQIEKFI